MPVDRSRLLSLVLVTAFSLVTACSGSSGDARQDAGSTTSTAPSTSTSSGTETTDDAPALVDIGEGRRLFVHCAGRGNPTVVLESGDESDQFQWSAVFRGIAEQTRVCAYDRLGNGSSDPATGCRRTPELLADLQAMLNAVDAGPPYVLVGTSGGGFLMTSYAYAHPADTVGIVLAETPHAIIPSREPQELLDEISCRSPLNQERRDYVAVERFVWEHRHRIGRIPMTVISNNYGKYFENEEQRTNVQGQRGWLVLSPLAKQVVVTSGHAVPENEPELTLSEILRVVTEARANL